jgi:hypothetical protein
MAERLINSKGIDRIVRVLKSGAAAEKGNVACIDLDDGALVVGAVDANYLPIGWFEETLTGDGTATIGVKLFSPVECAVLINSSTGPVDDGDVGALCYLHSAFEVSMTATGKSIAGRVWGISGSGGGAKVFVEMAPSLGLQGPVPVVDT